MKAFPVSSQTSLWMYICVHLSISLSFIRRKPIFVQCQDNWFLLTTFSQLLTFLLLWEFLRRCLPYLNAQSTCLIYLFCFAMISFLFFVSFNTRTSASLDLVTLWGGNRHELKLKIKRWITCVGYINENRIKEVILLSLSYNLVQGPHCGNHDVILPIYSAIYDY